MNYFDPIYRNIIPTSISAKSRALALRLRSPKSSAPQPNDTTTEERLIIATTAIIAEASPKACRYAISPAVSSIEIIGIAHDQWNGCSLRFGSHNTATITDISRNW